MCASQPFWLWIGCGNMDLNFPDAQKEVPKTEEVVWTCFAVAERPFWRFFQRVDMRPAVEKLKKELCSILSSQPEIQFVEEP